LPRARAHRLSAGRHRSSAGAYVNPEGKIGLVACDDDGLPGLDRLRDDRHVFLYAFDLIELVGNDLRGEPIEGCKVPRSPRRRKDTDDRVLSAVVT
jgi:hypothetical protein